MGMKNKNCNFAFSVLLVSIVTLSSPLSAQDTYMEPPKELVEIMMAPPLPETIFSNGYKKYAVIAKDSPMNEMAYLAGPEYKIAGTRINPANFTASRLSFSHSIRLADVATGKTTEVSGMPENPRITGVRWSPTDKYLCFLHHAPQELELWRIEVATAVAQKINKHPLNAVLGGNSVFAFLDDEQIIYVAVPKDLGAIPKPPTLPVGPVIQENLGKTTKLYTTTDLITSYYDEQLFDYFATVQFVVFTPEGSNFIGQSAIVRSFSLSPNKNYMLVTTINKPYSYQQAFGSFPNKLELWSTQGEVIKVLERNSGDEESEGRGNRNSTAPRISGYAWRNDMPETLVWKETIRPPSDSTLRDSTQRNTTLRGSARSDTTLKVSARVDTTLKVSAGNDTRLSGSARIDSTLRGSAGSDMRLSGSARIDSTLSGSSLSGSARSDMTAAGASRAERPEPKFTTALYQLHAPFDGEKQLVVKPEYPLGQVTWGNGTFALYTATSTKEKSKYTYRFVPADTITPHILLYSESTEVDSLGVFPVLGNPYLIKNRYGADVVYVDDKLSYLYFAYIPRFTLDHGTRKDSGGDNMLFIDRFDLKTKKAVNLWTGKAPYHETVVAITDFKNLKFISLRQSVTEVPNYFIVDPKANKMQQISFYTDPCPALRAIQKRLVTYTRKDGVPLTAMLYLPADYDQERDGKLPLCLYGYPRDYKCAADAIKDRPSRYLFNVSHYFYIATQGYAVMDFSTPIIAQHTKAQANDRFREELIMNAEAAINYIDSVGIGDRERVGVYGHSYGAFMTANLLAHTKLFKAGIARSGAYNRTLTHNGFQGEQRTFWKDPQFYHEMSPFFYADKIKTPILLIHGQMDNNSGTFPIQSERLFHALLGLGGNVRYVQLPFESHGYSAKESQLHVMYEMVTFMDKHLKGAKKAEPTNSDKPAGSDKPTDFSLSQE